MKFDFNKPVNAENLIELSHESAEPQHFLRNAVQWAKGRLGSPKPVVAETVTPSVRKSKKKSASA